MPTWLLLSVCVTLVLVVASEVALVAIVLRHALRREQSVQLAEKAKDATDLAQARVIERQLVEHATVHDSVWDTKPWQSDSRFAGYEASDGPDEEGFIHFTNDDEVIRVKASEWVEPR